MSRHSKPRNQASKAYRFNRRFAGVIIACLATTILVTAKWTNDSAAKKVGKRASSKPAAVTGTMSAADEDRALRREQLEAAEKLLSEFPTNDDVVYLAGLVREDQGDTEEAMKLWAKSINLDP